ncbi:hypothetical protein N8D56_17950 [Devosia sp. A8/3-2]|nr:hypothetical protein N8D56_17950 [Devosia sp. A8/3-2]
MVLQVLLAYDTTKLDPAAVPKTRPDLVARIKANPGQFIYNRPNKGGSGGNFVRRAIFEANGKDPSKFTVDNYTREAGDAMLNPARDILKDLAPSMFDGGAYTSGNTQSLQLLGQSAVTMIPDLGRIRRCRPLPGAFCRKPPVWSSSPTSACPAASPRSPCSAMA